jgi:hypothetical protein
LQPSLCENAVRIWCDVTYLGGKLSLHATGRALTAVA